MARQHAASAHPSQQPSQQHDRKQGSGHTNDETTRIWYLNLLNQWSRRRGHNNVISHRRPEYTDILLFHWNDMKNGPWESAWSNCVRIVIFFHAIHELNEGTAIWSKERIFPRKFVKQDSKVWKHCVVLIEMEHSALIDIFPLWINGLQTKQGMLRNAKES